MTIDEALILLRKDHYRPEDLFIENGKIHWQHDFGDVEEPGDVAWDEHCEMSEYVRRTLGEDQCEIYNPWADNDTAGFTIKLKTSPVSEKGN